MALEEERKKKTTHNKTKYIIQIKQELLVVNYTNVVNYTTRSQPT